MFRAAQERIRVGRISSSIARQASMRQGVTLIELLIVIVILIMVASIAIPLVRFNFSDRKIRESARQLSAYFTLAKTLAAERNRQVGVMFERTSGDLNRCQSMYIIEVPAPYSGDVLDARAYVRFNPALNVATYDTQWQVIFDTIEIPTGVASLKCAMLTHSRRLVDVGDTFLIRFNHRGSVYTVKRFQVSSTPSQDIFVMQGSPSPVPIAGCWMPADRDPMTGSYDFTTKGWGRTGLDDDSAGGMDDEKEQGCLCSRERQRPWMRLIIPSAYRFRFTSAPNVLRLSLSICRMESRSILLGRD
jgi:prepilin-type N-terminal cleavage/methylation domain-containing protein